MDIFVTSQLGAVVVLMLGAAGLLGLGSLALLVAKHPAFKQRIAEVTVFITAMWILLAFIPFPRWSHTAHYDSVFQSPSIVASLVPLVEPEPAGLEASGFEPTAFEPTEQVLALPIPAQHVNTGDETTTVIAPETATSLSLPEAVQFGYVSVSACLLAWVVLARIAMAIACTRWQPAPRGAQEVYDSIKKDRLARVMVSARNVRPMSFGIFNPMIVLPKTLCEQSESRTLRHVLLHEQAHIDRRDAFGNSLMILTLPLLWCQPLYWYLRFVADYSRELIADDVAAGQTDKLSYVDDLIKLLRRSDANSWGVAGAIGVLGFRHPFTRRMSDLVQRNERLPVKVDSRKAVLTYATAVAVLILAAASFGASSGIGQEPDQAPSPQTAPASQAPTPTDETTQTPSPISQVIDLGVGVTMPAVDLNITAADDGQIVHVAFVPGQVVEKGEVLATIANPELEQAFSEAAQNVRISEQSVESDVNLEDAENSAAMATAVLRKARKLKDDGGVISDAELQKLELAQSRSQLRIQMAESQQVKQQMELERDRLALKQLQERIERLQIRSPSHGIIESVHVSQGQSVRQGERLFRIISLDQIRVEFNVNVETMFPPDLLGHLVTARIESSDGQGISLTGKVFFVSSEVDVRNNSSAWAVCNNVRRNGHWAVRAGMRVHITVGGAVKPANEPSEAVSSQDDSIQEQLDDFKQQEVDYLKELIASQESLAEKARIDLENGTGTRQQESSARRDIWLSRAELFTVLGQVEAAYKKAIDFALEAERDLGLEFESGRGSAYEKLRASRIKAQIRLDYLRYQRERLKQQ